MVERRRLTDGGSYFGSPHEEIEFFSSGSKLLDLALGGGWAEQRLGNVVGDRSTGKTLLMIEAAANFILKYPDGIVRYREAEAAFDKAYAGALGMPLDKVDFGEKKLRTVEDLFRDLDKLSGKSEQPELYIVDSLDAISSEAELGREIDASSYGSEKAKKMSELFRRLIQSFSPDEGHHDRNMTMLIVSQVRDKIGATFGRKTTRTGGRAMDFYASQVLYLSQLNRLQKTVHNIKRVVGIEVKAMCDKNKIALPFREAQFPIIFGYGIDDERACLDWLKSIKQPVPRDTNLRAIRELTEKRWWEIERTFLPKRPKYAPITTKEPARGSRPTPPSADKRP